MKSPTPTQIIMLATLASATILSTAAQADILGFNNFGTNNPNGWSYNQSDDDTPAGLPNPNTLHITNEGGSQLRSAFHNTRQNTTEFTASFTYRAHQRTGNDQGISFILQNDPMGTNAISTFSSTAHLGYSGIVNSVAVNWDFGANTISYSTNGVLGGGSFIDDIDLGGDSDIDFTLTYDGNSLSIHLFDTVTGEQFNQPSLSVGDISSILGGDLAYVGFGATGVVSDQFLSNFSYTTVPTPSSIGILTAGLFAATRRRRS